METPSKETASQKFLALLDDASTKSEFVEAFSNVVKTVKKFEAKTEEDIRALVQTITQLQTKLDSDTSVTLEEMKAFVQTLKNGNDGYTPVKGVDYFDGEDADEDRIVSEVLARIVMPETRDPIMDTPIELRDKLETLEGDDRLDKSAIKGLPELEEELKVIAARPIGRGGTPVGVRLYIGGTKKGLAQYINLIAGSGVAITHNLASGRNDITISAAGGALAVLTATGDIDGVNATYTFASEPSIVVVNGASYRHTAGVTITGTSATLDFAPQVGSDVYAIG
ncbi:hypothetical protein [Bradyrhizobium sp. AUGA SZCCT0431]|uniref:hypothetical protein n=1 Tax=Bradyrhizobium sp. AUGA SZCCT0431 TaxID=2807674 RepID=UPI001BA6248C|nr:hypothetical protein [Bradyrhizobium sp. AUGA SZCCT0431]MBR1146671.1 hypothetical protein [Bradyrhizobium sp. AUGA SZCCT0431]